MTTHRDERITIRIGENGATFKSLGKVTLVDLPPLAVVTGTNGSGKSHLLEFIARQLCGIRVEREPGQVVACSFELVGDVFQHSDVAYLADRSIALSSPKSSLASLQTLMNNLLNELTTIRADDIALTIKRARLLKALGVNNLSQVNRENFVARLPTDFLFLLDPIDAVSGVAHVFQAYRSKEYEEHDAGLSREEIREKLGQPPWDQLNEILKDANFPYRVKSPIEQNIIFEYVLLLVGLDSDLSIDIYELSSGEAMILRLALWVFQSRRSGAFPRVLLLDEPDAHLHPSLTHHLFGILEALIKKFDVRVIMSTHSPSTVAIAPEGSIYILDRSEPRARRAESKQVAIGLLTSGLVVVSPGTRFVLLEGKSDVDFYETIRDILTSYGPRTDKMALRPAPSIAFLSAAKENEGGGGKTVVVHWVEKLSEPPLGELFFGIVDRDKAWAACPRVFAIERYCIENYLYDPVVFYAYANEMDVAPRVQNFKLEKGDESSIHLLPVNVLQSMADAVCAKIEEDYPALKTAAGPARPVLYTNGVTLVLPEWAIIHSGKKLIENYQRSFGGRAIPRSALLQNWRRVRLIPKELATILHSIQNVGSGAIS